VGHFSALTLNLESPLSQDRLTPPRTEVCLVRQRSSSQKGGTIIAEDVVDIESHGRRLCEPDGYRPRFCPSCGKTRLHVHDYRERKLRAEPGAPVARIVRHACVGCAAIWQTLPAFLARHLWRSWRVVERVLTGAAAEAQRWPRVPERTRRRWRARWLRPVRFLAQVLATCGEAAWATLSGSLGAAATCADLVAVYALAWATPAGQRLSCVAALVHRLLPQVRLV
jgi:hypothetical protein